MHRVATRALGVSCLSLTLLAKIKVQVGQTLYPRTSDGRHGTSLNHACRVANLTSRPRVFGGEVNEFTHRERSRLGCMMKYDMTTSARVLGLPFSPWRSRLKAVQPNIVESVHAVGTSGGADPTQARPSLRGAGKAPRALGPHSVNTDSGLRPG